MNKIILLPLFILNIHAYAHAASLEVLHWWTAPGELESQQILEKALHQQDINWYNFAIVGGGGDSAMRVLQMRALSGNPPDAAQIKGPDIGEWTKLGMLEEVENLVDTREWQTFLPQVVRDTVVFNGHYMAVPINIHRVNWLWLNKKIFNELKLSPPRTWEQFFATADKIKAAGYLPLAHGGTPWQDTLLFDSMALSMLGAEKYKLAFVKRDNNVLNSPEMVSVFKQYKRLHDYVDQGFIAKDWAEASQLIATGKAGMQFMGDWAKGVWRTSDKVAMVDYQCVDVPGSEGLFSYNIDSFVLFKKHHEHENAQETFINILLSKQFQKEFNNSKGSLSVRNDIDMTLFDACAQKSYHDFNTSELVPALTQNMASTSNLQNVITQIISDYFNAPDADASEAVKHLSTAIRALK